MDWLKHKLKLPTRKSTVPTVEEDDSGKHASVREADPYSFQVAHRRLAWLFRISAGTNIVLAACLTLAINAIVEIAPLIGRTELALVRSDPADNRLYRIEPLNDEVEGFNLVLEDKARRFVHNCLAIDRVTQRERMAECKRMSDKHFWEKFEKERIDSGKINDAIAHGLTRSISVETVNSVASFEGTYKYAVDFIQSDEYDGKITEEKKLRAYLNLTTRAQVDVPEEDKYENPLGIVVIDLVPKKRANL